MPDNDDGCSDPASGDELGTPHTTADNGLGDDFDDFEAEGDDDDFGDFDDNFEQPLAAPEPAESKLPSISKYPFVSSSKYISSLVRKRHICPVHSRGVNPA